MRSVLLHGSVPKSHYLKYVFVLCSDSTTIIYLSSSLHWLPIDSQIQYKLASLCCNCLKSTAPVYLTEVTNQPASYALLLILPFSVFPLRARVRLVRDLCLMLHRLSGTVSLAKLDHQTDLRLSNQLWNLTSLSYSTVCVCVCSWKFVLTIFWFFVCNGLCAPIWKNSP